MTTLCDAEDATLQLIHHYLNRRRTVVVEAMIHFRPNLVAAFDLQHKLGIDDLQPSMIRLEKEFRNNAEHFSGRWKEHWQYQLHGIGCEMVHVETGEHFNWDMGDPLVFSTFELFEYLRWYETKNRDDNLDLLIAYVDDLSLSSLKSILEALKLDGRLDVTPEDDWQLVGSISNESDPGRGTEQ